MSAKKILFFISLLLFIIFVYYSYLVAKETFTQIDFDTTVKLQDHIISRRFDLPFSVFSILGSVEITGIIWFAILVLSVLKRYWLTVAASFLFWVAIALEVFGKVFVYHPGPPFLFYRGVLKFNFPSSYAHTDYSYPSGHLTRTSFLVSFILVFLYLKTSKKIGILPTLCLVGFLSLMILSRIYLGEHWTTDVIGGTLLGSSLGILTALTIPQKKKLASNLGG